MLTTRFVVPLFFSVAITVPGAGVVFGQNFPNKPIRILTGEAGGSSDFVSRLISQELSLSLGQPVIVDNRPGGIIPAEIVSKAPPDGYTMLVSGGVFWIGSLIQKTPYDPVRDFLPITLTSRQPNVVVAPPSMPVKSIKELIALAKARPGELNYASAPTGSPNHLAVELFKSMAGVNIVRVPYKGTGPGLIDLVASRVQLMFASTAGVSPHLKSGKLRPLAVTSAQPSVLLPGLPTVAATLPGYEAESLVGVFAPAKTSKALINRLNQEIVRVFNMAEVKEKLLSTGVEAVGSSPEQLAGTINSELATLRKLIKDIGIKAE